MLEEHKIYLYDRIKETSYVTGIQDFVLNGHVPGFSSFGSVYSNNDNIFYAATDGVHYEIGSGVYVTGVLNHIVRYPFRSSNSNQKISFGEGIKEIFVTYPATHSVYSASGLQNLSAPEEKGIAFWSSSNIINYDSNLIWDSGLRRLGIQKSLPVYAIDIGGPANESIIRSSGIAVGSSGIIFPFANNGDSSYQGGVQLTHYEMNQLDQFAYDEQLISEFTGLSSVVSLSGNANQFFLLNKQNAGFVFAGPVSGCTPPCSPDYPVFRPLILKDIAELDGFSSEVLFDNINETGFRFDKPVAIATATRESSKLFIYNENDNNKNAAWFASITHSSSSSSKKADVSFVATSLHKVDSGVDATSGTMTAASFFSLRNSVNGDAGTLSGIYGVYIGYGNDSGVYVDQNPITKNSYGLYVAPFDGSGTLQNAYDIYLADTGIGSGVINKHYGIYQDGDQKINVLNGRLGVNCVPSSGIICSLNNNFDPTVASGWLNSAYAASGLYGGGIALLDTSAVNPGNRYGYSVYTTDQGINLNFSMASVTGVAKDVLKLHMINENSVNQATMVFYGDKLNIRYPKTPASATSPGNSGDICWDNNYLYVCVSENTWKRSYLSTW